MKPAIITLLTDFGSQDYFVGAMKGVILSINPGATIVDISHEVPPQDIEAAAFNLLCCYRNFPPETVHLVVVDPGVGSERRAILIESANQFFVGPDNGLFSWICEREQEWVATHVTKERFFRQPVSNTFHGRDIFAPVAAALSKGLQPQEFGEPLPDIVRLRELRPIPVNENTVEGRIIHVDRFGNCITNLARQTLRSGGMPTSWKIVLDKRDINSFYPFFAEAQPDEIFCTLGSAGFLEICARNASAAKLLQVERGHKVLLICGALREISARLS